MLRLENVKPEEMPEVLRVAQQLYAKDQSQIEQAQRRQEIVEAAEEVGIPQEYLERAAAEVHRQRVAEIQRHQGGKKRALAVLVGGAVGVGVAAGLLWMVPVRSTLAPATPAPRVVDARQAAPAIPVETFDAAAATRWTLDKDAASAAEVRFENRDGRQGVAVIRVDRLAGAEPRVNLEALDTPPPLAGHREIRFDAQARGLSHVRLDLEAGPTERWRSPRLPLTGEWNTLRVPLDRLEYQTRRSPTEPWRLQRYRAPEGVRNLSFKVGHYINDAGASGEVALDDVRFE